MKLNWLTFAVASLSVIVVICLWRFLPNNPTALMLAGTIATALMSAFPKLLGADSSGGDDAKK